MSFAIMWVLISVCLCRVFYTGIKEKNYGYVVGSLVLLAWSVYQVLCYTGIVPPEYVVGRIEGFVR